MSITPGTRFGPYAIEGPLGAGGMGEVYRAHDGRLNRAVAIKILPARVAGNDQLRERFDREAKAVAALNHPNICTIYDVGDADGTPFIAMELLEGATLEERIRSGRLPASDALDIGIALAAGLDAAHGKGIVHRDLKPSNIFLTSSGQTKIMDFGLARFMPESANSMADTRGGTDARTIAGSTLGTAGYMSPEQARGEPVDARADLFSFGAVLFEAVTGGRAFLGTTLATTFDAVLHHSPPGVRTLVPGLPAALEQIIARALEKARAQRYQTAAALGADLKALRDGRRLAIAASTSSPARRPVVRWAALGAALLVVGAGVWVSGWARRTSTLSDSAATIRSVAVLPLANLSGQVETDYFSDGMTEELISALARFRGWRVISRTSVMQYKNTRKPLPDIARELGVDALIEGTVQQANDRVRITATLVRGTRDEERLWTQTFDRSLRDVMDLQADVARTIASRIQLTLTPQEQQRLTVHHSVDPDVFQLYLKGRASANLGTEDALMKAIAYFDHALAKDPAYAPAHAAAALTWASLNPDYRAPKDVMPKAREHAVKAIELDEGLSEAHVALANVMFRYEWDWSGAEQELRRALDLNPNSADAHELYGNYLSSVAKHPEAIAEVSLAHQLNPSSRPTYSSLLSVLIVSRDYDRTIAEARRAVELHPDFGYGYGWLGLAYVMKGQVAEAIPILERARMLDNNVTTTHFLAMAQAAAGHTAEARKLVAALEAAANDRYACAFEVASVHVQLGDTEQAMKWLDRGIDEQCDCMVWLTTEPWMDPLHTDPRYASLIKRVGFPTR